VLESETAAVLLGEPLPVELMNTVVVDRDGVVRDALETDAGVLAWLRAVAGRIEDETGVELGAPGEDEVRRAAVRLRELRAALRRLAMDATGDSRPPVGGTMGTRAEAVAALNGLATAWPELVWPPEGEPRQVIRAAGSPLEVAAGLLAHQGVELFAGERRGRLRACVAPNCLLFFVKEHSRREWCCPACGNRARVARHYRRHHLAGRA
jgi:predicted RNA-binding Zn ribbon-like protein